MAACLAVGGQGGEDGSGPGLFTAQGLVGMGGQCWPAGSPDTPGGRQGGTRPGSSDPYSSVRSPAGPSARPAVRTVAAPARLGLGTPENLCPVTCPPRPSHGSRPRFTAEASGTVHLVYKSLVVPTTPCRGRAPGSGAVARFSAARGTHPHAQAPLPRCRAAQRCYSTL